MELGLLSIVAGMWRAFCGVLRTNKAINARRHWCWVGLLLFYSRAAVIAVAIGDRMCSFDGYYFSATAATTQPCPGFVPCEPGYFCR